MQSPSVDQISHENAKIKHYFKAQRDHEFADHKDTSAEAVLHLRVGCQIFTRHVQE